MILKNKFILVLTKKRNPILALLNKIQDKYLLNYKHRIIWNSLIKLFLIKYQNFAKKKEAQLLHKNGYLILKPVDKKLVSKIKSIAESNFLYDPWNKDQCHFKKKDRPSNITIARLVNPASYVEIQDLALSIIPLRICATFFKCKCVIDSLDVWWSFPSKGLPLEAENFHRDRDSSEFLKWFVYLTDVDDNNGPHEYALKSSTSKNLTKGGRYKDDQVYNLFKTKKFLGKEGLNFIENTYGLHRGYKPQTRERLVFQVRYSIHGSSFRYKEDKSKLNSNFKDPALSYSYIS